MTTTAADQPVVVERTDGLATVRINRPEAMNALDLPTKEALLAALREVADDDAVRAVVLTGTGRAFCVGQDLKEHADDLAAGRALGDTVVEHYNPIVTLVATMAKPVVAAVNGVAAGAGASLALAADLRLVAASGGFNTAFTAIGLSCDTGSSWSLPHLVGVSTALELLLTPRTVPAEEAVAMGLAGRVVPDDELAAEAQALGTRLAQGPTAAYAAVREAVRFASTHDLQEALAHEAELMRRTGATQDHRDAVQAFLSKQQPRFTGR